MSLFILTLELSLASSLRKSFVKVFQNIQLSSDPSDESFEIKKIACENFLKHNSTPLLVFFTLQGQYTKGQAKESEA